MRRDPACRVTALLNAAAKHVRKTEEHSGRPSASQTQQIALAAAHNGTITTRDTFRCLAPCPRQTTYGGAFDKGCTHFPLCSAVLAPGSIVGKRCCAKLLGCTSTVLLSHVVCLGGRSQSNTSSAHRPLAGSDTPFLLHNSFSGWHTW